jgi:hypothetical protein
MPWAVALPAFQADSKTSQRIFIKLCLTVRRTEGATAQGIALGTFIEISQSERLQEVFCNNCLLF